MVEEFINKIELKAIIDNFDVLLSFIESQLELAKIVNNDRSRIMTACDEILINIINYAYPNEKGDIEIQFENKHDQLTIRFIDSGSAFNPMETTGADVTLPLEERNPGGLGILIVKNLMSDVSYEYKENKNILSITLQKEIYP